MLTSNEIIIISALGKSGYELYISGYAKAKTTEKRASLNSKPAQEMQNDLRTIKDGKG